MSSRLNFFRASLLLLGVVLSLPGHAAKTDIVILINGNAVTGEIKKLEFGSLRYSTDSMGTVNIDWEDITNVTSNQHLQIELTDGSRYFGTLLVPEDRYIVRVKTASDVFNFPANEIIRITPIEGADRIWQRLDGSIKIGLRTEKSSEVTTSDLDVDVSYRTRNYLIGLKTGSSVTRIPKETTEDGSTTGGTTARQNIEVNYQRFRANRWFTDWYTRWERSDELGINSRISIGGSLGRYFVQTNKNQFSVAAGLQGANTTFTSDLEESATEAEGRIEIRYLRRSLVPEASLSFTSKLYPLIEDLSNYRAETNVSLRREFFDDLFLDLTLAHSYISNPPSDAASSDYTVTTSVGFSF